MGHTDASAAEIVDAALVGHPMTVKGILLDHHTGIANAEKAIHEHPALVKAFEEEARAAIAKNPNLVNKVADEIEKATVLVNGPRPSCPYGNCGPVLGPHDVVGTTFYIACNMMLAFTLFFFVQVSVVPRQWKTSVCVAGLVTGVAWYNYTLMKDQWVQTQQSPTTYRYTDWLITVPLQITEFYFILKSSGSAIPASLGLRLFTTSIMMVFFGWLAEINVMAKLVGFVLGCACWLYIVYESFAGEASMYAAKLTSASSKQAYGTLRLIVTVGWVIYPLGFAIAYLCFFDQPAGVLSGTAMAALNVTYNLADFVNKGAFGLCVWSAAIADKESLI